ncbi:MAG: sugar kinase [Clostridia bacterium]|nr:sugar kinase [Clostridia bacterium]
MKLLAFGEIMGRMTTHGYERVRQASEYTLYFGGSEANVAVCLAHFGEETAFVTKLPDNDLGELTLRTLRAHDVDVSGVVRGKGRLGLYFVEKGAAQRPSKVIYDRAGSAIATADPSEFDWARLLEGCDRLHLTGITPALSDGCAQMCMDAAKAAKARGITVSCDINYRSALWSREKAGEVLRELMPYVDVAIANEEHMRELFDIQPDPSHIDADGELTDEGYASLAARFSEKFDIPVVAMTLRRTITADDNKIRGMVYMNGGEIAFSRWYQMHMVDRIGGGDAFTAGLLYALMHNYTPADGIEFAVASSALKHAIESDFNDVTVAEVTALVKAKHGAGRVQR